jgi:hypothetical protein
VGEKRKQKAEQEGESWQQEEAFRLEIDAGDPDQTNERKRQKMRGTMEERHVDEELHAKQSCSPCSRLCCVEGGR